MTAGEAQAFFDQPLELHGDAQYFYTDIWRELLDAVRLTAGLRPA